MMNKTTSFGLLMALLLSLQSCFNPSKPNYQYFPNMYEPVGYETYADTDAFANGIEAQLPVEGSINRGWVPYDYPDSNEGYEAAKAELKSPIEVSSESLKQGKELYGIYCAVCHGNKGDGQGILMTREKYLGVPNYAARDITPGSIYHVLMFGRNAMGSHAGQVNAVERWQIAQHVMELRQNLIDK
jgi:mono/diheme cytochrome c family protein